jgi:hypothetical protein
MKKSPLYFFILSTLLASTLPAQNILINRQLNDPFTARAGDIDQYQVSPDEQYFVYVADQDLNDAREIYSVSVDGSSTPTKLNDDLGIGSDVNDFLISPDSSTVVYLLGRVENGEFFTDLYSVPITGGTPVQLNPEGENARTDFVITPDSARVIFGSQDAIDRGYYYYEGQLEEEASDVSDTSAEIADGEDVSTRGNPTIGTMLYSIPINGGPLTVVAQSPDETRALGSFSLSPDGSTIVVLGDLDVDNQTEIYSVPSTGGNLTKLNDPPLDTNRNVSNSFKISPDSQSVVFRFNNTDASFPELYSAPIDGSTSSTQVSAINSESQQIQTPFVITNDSARVVYRVQAFYSEDLLRIAPLDGLTSPSDLTVQESNRFISNNFQLTSDDRYAIIRGNLRVDNTDELFAIDLSVLSDPIPLHSIPVDEGDVFDDFQITPDNSRVVFRGDLDTDNQVELYSALLPGSIARGFDFEDDATTLNATLPDAQSRVDEFNISPDGLTVTYIADQDTTSVRELYSVPIDGSTSPMRLARGNSITKLNSTLPEGGNVRSNSEGNASSMLFAGNRVGFIAELSLPDVGELYSVPYLGGQDVRLSTDMAIGGDIDDFDITPDSSRVLFTARLTDNSINDLYTVPAGGGTNVMVNSPAPADSDVSNVVISNDSSKVAFVLRTQTGTNGYYYYDRSARGIDQRGDSRNSDSTIFSANTDGTGLVEIANNLLSSNSFNSIQITPDSTRVLYRETVQNTDDAEVFMRNIDGSGVITRVNDELTTGGRVVEYQISSDSRWVVYEADQVTENNDQLFAVQISNAPVRGGGGGGGMMGNSILLTPEVDDSADINDFLITADGTTVVFEADSRITNRDELFSVPIDGSTTSTQLTPDFESFADVRTLRLSPDSKWAVYRADQDRSSQDEIYSVPVDGSTTETKLNPTLPATSSADTRSNYIITNDSQYVVMEAEVRNTSSEDVYATPIAGGTPIQLSDPNTTGTISDLTVSPDSQKVAFTFRSNELIVPIRGESSNDETLTIASITGGALATLTSPRGFSEVTFSPDSEFVFYRESVGNDEQLYRIPITGGMPQIINGPSDTRIDISSFEPTPNGVFIIYSAEQDTPGSFDLYSTEIVLTPNGLLVK